MIPSLTLPNGRTTTALGFGCASLLRLPEASDRQHLLDLAVDLGICHFDVARLYGLGLAEAELSLPLRRHPGDLTVATKFGLGTADPPSPAAQRQGGLRRLLQRLPALRPLARRFYGTRMVPRDFSAAHCRQSLSTSLDQLGLGAVDLLLLHEPSPRDTIDPGLEACLQQLHCEGLIGGFGISGCPQQILPLCRQRPQLASHCVQWDDHLLLPDFAAALTKEISPVLKGRFGRIRHALVPIQQAFAAVPQLQHHWSDRLNLSLAETDALVAALLGSALAGSPGDLLLFSTTQPDRLRRILTLLHSPPWDPAELIAFERFWRLPASTGQAPCS